MKQGWIGQWSPGIGDPTLGGWVTVLLYLVAAWTTWRLLRDWVPSHRHDNARYERWFWRLLFLALTVLAVNKQLDLQSALTELGRIAATEGGWYADRRQVQVAFIAGMGILGLTLFAATVYLTWGAPASTQWALVGATVLVVFVVVRAASFHRVDALLAGSVFGVRVNWALEIGGLLLIAASTWWRRRHKAAPSPR